ncbi:MAG: DMT family transporter [Thermodesulfobacteriota bacterium]
MPLDIMLAILFGAALHATWNAFVRSAPNKFMDTILALLGMGFWAGCFLPFVPLPATASWPYLIASILIHVAYFALVVLTYRYAELSFAYPIMRGTAPAFSAILAAYLLQESPSLIGWFGVFLISGGVIILSLDAWRLGSLNPRSFLFALSNAAVIVIYTLVDGVGVRLSGNAASYIGWAFFLPIVPIFVTLLIQWRGPTSKYAQQHVVRGLIGGACILGSYGIALWAMTRAPIALVAALRETSVLFALVIAALFLSEQISRWRFLSILAICAGAVAIKLS